MNSILSSAIAIILSPTLLTLVLPAAHAQQTAPVIDMTPVQPESVGFSAQRLERLHAAIQDEINNKQLAGAVTILARHGKIVDYHTYGVRDLATSAPMTKDTIFRDYSMTKPVTGVAMMILYEQGKWLPSDPISKRFIPPSSPTSGSLQRLRDGVERSYRLLFVEDHHGDAGDGLGHGVVTGKEVSLVMGAL